jgi:hypothetical protein
VTLAPSIRPRVITRRAGLGYKGYISSVPAHLCPLDKAWGKLSNQGVISTVASAPTAGGTGYTLNDVLTISTGGTGGTVTATGVSAGIVTAVTLTTAGTGYTTGTGKATTGGTGTGCTVNITALVDPGTDGSHNLLYDPAEEKFYRRAGSTAIGGTNGILESTAGMRARQLISFDSPSLRAAGNGGAGGDGYPTHCVLYTVYGEASAASQLYLRSTIGPINYVLGQEFNATNHYPGTTAATFNFKVIPYYSYIVSALDTFTFSVGRLNTAALRSVAFAGSRRMLQVNGWLYLPSQTPMRWNGRFNESSSSGSQNLRLWHTGPIPPLLMPTVADGTANANGVWQANDVYFISYAYQRSDGSVSAPIIPRDINDILTSGLGRCTVSASCNYRDWSGIGIGPDGTEGRWLYRTPKFNSTSSTGTSPAIRDLRVVDYIPNNTDTTYRDFKGNDLELKDRPDIVRFDQIMPPTARYIDSFDGRVIIGYTSVHPAMIYLTPNVNADDDSATLLTTSYQLDPTSPDIVLYKGATTTTVSGTALTYQQVVDTINATTDSGSNGGKWWAQLAPGVDGSRAFIGTTATVADVGDTAGRMRAFGSSYPGVVHQQLGTKVSAFASADRFLHKGRWFFTQGGPDMPAMLADSYLAGNYRTGQDSWGILMGFSPMEEGCLIFFSKAIIWFTNKTTGKTGLDEDYHPYELFTDMGCIAWDSITHGNGWAGCLTEQGYFVFDTQGRRRNISVDLWNAATQTGEWAYEIVQCSAATAADNDESRFHSKVMGNKIRCTWRSNSGASIPNRYSEYDFSLSASNEGIGQVLRPNGEPWGWSPPSGLSIAVMGEVRKSTGVARYGTVESNAGATNGRIDQFETGTTDNGTVITANLWGGIDFSDSLDKKSAQEVRPVYKANSSGITFQFRRTNGQTTETPTALAIPTTGSGGTFAKIVVPLPQAQRSQSIGYQARWIDDGSGSAMEVWGYEVDLLPGSSY